VPLLLRCSTAVVAAAVAWHTAGAIAAVVSSNTVATAAAAGHQLLQHVPTLAVTPRRVAAFATA
jgi:hypothetical protein